MKPFSFNQLKVWLTGLLIALLSLSTALNARPINIAVISDLNGNYGSTDYSPLANDVVEKIIQIKPDLVISTGDMVAGQRKPLLPRKQVESMWASFHRVISDPLAKAGIPFVVTPGNHDGADSPDFHGERIIYAEQWRPRKPALRYIDDAHYPFYYAFELGNVVFVSVDATLVGPLPKAQMNWLETLLAKLKLKSSQIVLFSHVPLWPFAVGRERDFIGDIKLERLLQDSGVDLYLSGHHHAFYPGHKAGIYYVSQACVGAGPRPLLGGKDISGKGFTLIRFDNEKIRINAFQEENLSRPLDWESLPATVQSKSATLLRADRIKSDINRTIDLPSH